MRNFILCFVMLIASSGVLRADAVTFEATVNSARISMDEVIQLTLTVTGVNDNLDPVSLPVIDGFSTKYLGPSNSTSFIFANGKSESHVEKSFIYELYPNKAGKFQVPSITATFSGQTYATKPIDLEVFENSAQAQASNGVPDQSQTSSTESLKDKILVQASVDKTDVYLNERVPLTIKLLVNGVPVRDVQYPQFDKTGLTVDDYDKPEQNSEVLNGIRYDTVEFKTNIYPDHLGDINLGPVQIQGNLLYKNHQEAPFNEDSNPFGAEVFNGFFDTYSTRPVTVSSQPIQLHVASLPEDNRPQDFSGAIGQFDFQASVSPAQVKVGDPLTLKMDIKGDGNLNDLKMPVFNAEGFKTYSPQIKEKGFEKTAEEVIIPTSANVKEVPAVRFSYFDTSLKDYKTITQGPFPIQVTAPSADQDFKAVGFTDISRGSAVLPPNQVFFTKMMGQIKHFVQMLFRSLWFWLGCGVIFAAWTAYYLWQRFQDLLRNDPAFRRRHMAVREAKEALAPAQGYISAGKAKDFYALISKVLRDYLANKWHESSAALSVEEILIRLKTARMDEPSIAKLRTLWEQADLVCFAGGERSSTDMQADLSQVQGLITLLEKKMK